MLVLWLLAACVGAPEGDPGLVGDSAAEPVTGPVALLAASWSCDGGLLDLEATTEGRVRSVCARPWAHGTSYGPYVLDEASSGDWALSVDAEAEGLDCGASSVMVTFTAMNDEADDWMRVPKASEP